MKYLLLFFLIFSFTAQAGKARCFNPTKTNSKKQLKLEEIAHQELRRAKSKYNLSESNFEEYDEALKNLLETGMPTPYQAARYAPLSRAIEELADTPTPEQLAIYYRKKIIEILIRADLKKAISKEKDLIGINLSRRDLKRFDFSGKDLSRANFTDAILTWAIFTDTNLTNANFSKANLTNTNLTNANLTNAILPDAHLPNANLTNANLSNTNLSDAILTRAIFTDANLTNTDLRGAIYNKDTILSKALTEKQKKSMIFIEE